MKGREIERVWEGERERERLRVCVREREWEREGERETHNNWREKSNKLRFLRDIKIRMRERKRGRRSYEVISI